MKNRYLIYFIIAGLLLGSMFGALIHNIKANPNYGKIVNANTDVWEYDAEESLVMSKRALCQIGTSQYYLDCAIGDTGTDLDGFLRVIKIYKDNGTIYKTLIDKWEYDTTDGSYACIQSIPNTNIYAILFRSNSVIGTIITTRVWENNGTLQKTILDTQDIISQGSYFDFQRITNNIFMTALRYGAVSTNIQTWWISSNGLINNTRLSSYNSSIGGSYETYPYITIVDYNTVAVAWASQSTYLGKIYTFDISGTGIITHKDYWNYSYMSYYQMIKKIYGNVYAIVSGGANDDGWVNTTTISDTGIITKSWIDTQKFDASRMYFPFIFNVVNSSAYGISYRGKDDDGYICTMNISNTGIIANSNLSSLEFNTVDNGRLSYVQYINESYYAILYESTNFDGWITIVNILTNWASPTISNVFIDNASSLDIIPQCRITINDNNGDDLTIKWYEYSTCSWTLRQTNSSCINGTYYWTFDEAIGRGIYYYWRINVSDGLHHIWKTYNFFIALPSIAITVYENLDNVTGSYATSYNAVTGWKIWNNYTGNCTGGGGTFYTNRTINISINGHGFFISWNGSVNTSIQNITILMNNNKSIVANFSDNDSYYEDKYFLSGTLIIESSLLFLGICLSLWLFFISKYFDEKSMIFGLIIFGISIPTLIILGVLALSFVFGFVLVFLIPILSLYILTDSIFYEKEKKKKK